MEWYCLTTTTDYHTAVLLQQRLQEHGIDVVLVNKLDRLQLAWGFVEIQVPLQQMEQALELLDPS